ncbi:MAG: putative pre-16S rRNA nuclease [Candidatus Hydrogenedentota bacterium]
MGECGRILGLDVGDVRIGVAVSDALGMMAHPKETIQCVSLRKDVGAVGRVVEETGSVRVVVGLPLSQDGSENAQSRKSVKFAEALREALGVPVELVDERFTTAIARRSMSDMGVKRDKRKGIVDQIAAQQLLQTYLDRSAHQGNQTRA